MKFNQLFALSALGRNRLWNMNVPSFHILYVAQIHCKRPGRDVIIKFYTQL